VNRFVRGAGDDADATDALRDFKRFPQWMWRNADVLDFVGWLRAHNDTVAFDRRVGFYGLDLYSLHASIAAVLQYLRRVDPDAARRAEARYACFDHFGPELQDYGHATALGITPSCEKEVVDQLVELCSSAGQYARRLGTSERDATFAAQQNARVVRDAEEYYRTMVRGGPASWNLRDRHMADTLEALRVFLGGGASADVAQPKLVVWAHNSHLGNAKWTEMSSLGELNLGQLIREKHGDDAVLVGFTTYAGTVTAASQWDAVAERKVVRPALPGSYELLFHSTGLGNFLLLPDPDNPADEELIRALDQPFLERAIGVIYRPATERLSHYFLARLPRQFDAVLHYDVTRAVEPLERAPGWDRGEMPETFPSAL
jgi:erythromycin esterase-like protein